MTAADLIAALQRLPQHLPVKVVLGRFNDADGSIFYLREGDEGAVALYEKAGAIDAAKGESNGTVRAERSGFDTLPDDYETGDY